MKEFAFIVADKRIWQAENMGFMNSALIKLPDCKTCSVIWSDNECGWEHVSVSPKHKFSIPTWDDMCVLKDIFFYDEEVVYQIHPAKSQYVNIVDNCLHLWKPKDIDLKKIVEEKWRKEQHEKIYR